MAKAKVIPRPGTRVTRLGVTVALLAVAGCNTKFSATKPPAKVFRIPLDVSLGSLDPALVTDNFSIDVLQNTFQGLVAMGEDNLPHPCLADSWTVSKNGKTYTFHLRPNVRFHSGRLLESKDVERSIERACSSALNAPLAAHYLSDIVGVEAYHAGRARRIAGIRVLDSETVSLDIDAARPYFLAKLTLPSASILDRAAVADGVHIKSVSEMQGTGPFRFEEYEEDRLLVQRAFDGYWGGKPKIDAIERPVMPDEGDRIAAYKRGELDVLPQISRANYAAFSTDPALKPQLKLIDRATLVYLAMNARVWSDQRVRVAIAKAIDNDEIATDTMLGTVTAAKSIIPVGIPGHSQNHTTWPAHDPQRARALLQEQGHENGKGLGVLRIAYAMGNPDIERIADRIAGQIHEALGIDVKLDKMDTATLIEKQNRRELDCIVSGWFADYIDPQDFLSMLLVSSSPENHWSYHNPEFDRRCARADVEQDAELRKALYGGAEDIALADAVLIPICYWKVPMMVSPRVHGIRSYAGQFLPYETVTLGP